MGYFRSRNFRITHAKLNFEGFIFVHFQLQDNLSIRDLLLKSFIFEGVALFEIFENKTPSKITHYTVVVISARADLGPKLKDTTNMHCLLLSNSMFITTITCTMHMV